MANETQGGMFRIFQGRSGTYTLNGATPVVVADKRISPNSIVESTIKTVNGTPGARLITSITPGVGFTVTGSAGDTSVYNYIVLR